MAQDQLKIFIAQQNYHIGNFDSNLAKILEAVSKARAAGADLVVFSELSVCGYPPRDFLEFGDFIARCRQSVETVASQTEGIGVILGAPSVNPSPQGKRLYNSGLLLQDGKVAQVIHKTLLPNYDIFDEYRYFEPAKEWSILRFKGWKIALTICEDIWNLGDHPLYPICPMDRLMVEGPDLMINISASPFDYQQKDNRTETIRRNVEKYRLPLIYCNAVGAQTELVFDGASLVFDREGKILHQLPYFREACLEVMVGKGSGSSGRDVGKGVAGGSGEFKPSPRFLAGVSQVMEDYDPERNIEEIHGALILGIRDYFSKMGFSGAVLGSSGGVDSAVTLAIAVEALGKEKVRALLMPSPFSTEHSIQDALELSDRLGNQAEKVRIDGIFSRFLETLEPIFGNSDPGLSEENLQARIRGNILMAVANRFGMILLNTSNKSELSTGYGTLYGDMAGGLSVIGDLYKTQVYAMARYLNRKKTLIPENILRKAPSAELRPGQKDTDSLPEYEILDPVLYSYIEKRLGPGEITAEGYDPSLVARVLKLVNASEYKRNQFCPILRVSLKAFGMGRRMPIVGKYLG